MITLNQKKKWQSQGFCVSNKIFSQDELSSIKNTLSEIKFNEKGNEFGSKGGFLEFPTEYDIINDFTLHPNIIKSCQYLLESKDIRLIQSDIWIKRLLSNSIDESLSNSDQRIHMDYPNNYLIHPSEWNKPESVAIIIYYSDSKLAGGKTSLVPNLGDDDWAYQPPYKNIAGLGKYHWYNDRTTTENYFKKYYPDIAKFREDLYKREIEIDYQFGTVLFYRHDLWHRGTPINLNQKRIVQNLGFKKAQCDWITCWNKGWARDLCWRNDKLERFIRKADNEQRKCLGIPDMRSQLWSLNQKKYMDIRYEERKPLSKL